MSPFLRYLRQPQILFALLALLIFTLGLSIRLYDLTDQPIDFHPTRQLRGAIVARGMYYEMDSCAEAATRRQAIAFWQSTGQYELPILERIVALTYLIMGTENFWVARIFNSLFWIIGGVGLIALARRMVASSLGGGNGPEAKAISNGSALIASAYFLVLPFGVQASRSFQPDPGMVMWIVLSNYCLYRWSQEQSWKWAILTGLLSGIAILVKAVAFYIVAAAMASMILYTFGLLRRKPIFSSVVAIFRNPQVWSMALIMIAPAGIYYMSRGGRASEYFSSWTLALSHLLLQPWVYLRWLNLAQELVGAIALLIALAGVLLAKPHNRALLLGLSIGYLIYGLTLPYQIYTHNYYHLQLIPIVALSLVPVAQAGFRYLYRQNKVWQFLFVTGALTVLAYSSWTSIVPLYSQNYRDEPAYWQEIASYLPTDGKIIALTQDYGYRLMYYGWRKVTLWPNRGEQKLTELRGSQKDFQEYFAKRTAGKRYFLITAFGQFEDQPNLRQSLYENYPVLAEGNGYIIFDLSQPMNRPTGSN